MSTTRARRAVAGVLIAVAALALSACDPRESGSAAVIGDYRVSESALAGDAKAVISLRAKAGATAVDTAALLPALLDRRVEERLLDVAAERKGIRVTQGEVDTLITQSGGLKSLQKAFATADDQGQWASPQRVESAARAFLVQQRLGAALAPSGDEAAQRAAASDYLITLAKELGVTVSPRYGTWDPKTATIGAGGNDLSRLASPAASASASAPSG